MPKSETTLKNQIRTCEQNVKEILTQMHMESEEQDFCFQYKFSDFANCVTTDDLGQMDELLDRAIYFLEESKKVTSLEKKRLDCLIKKARKKRTQEKSDLQPFFQEERVLLCIQFHQR